MPPYTLGQAAKATGKQKSTIAEAIKKGRLSGTKNEHGQYQIDPAELHRVYGIVSDQDGMTNPPTEQHKTHDQTARIMLLEAQLKAMVELKEQIISERDDLRQRLDKEGEERRRTQAQLTALLTDQRERAPEPTPQAPPRRKWFVWR